MKILTSRHMPVLLGAAVFIIVLAVYLAVHPRGISSFVIQSYANSAAPVALAALAQTFPVLTGGLDLSVGGMVALTNALASELVQGSPVEIAFGVLTVLAAGALCGALNGALIVYGRLQPIIGTLATGAVFSGIALFIRPFPGGDVDTGLAYAMTAILFGVLPVSTLLIAIIASCTWAAISRASLGRGIFAAGSAPQAARLSGLRIERSIIAAYVLSGLFSALAGLYLGFQTLSGDATIGVPYTINSIAAIVIGGLSLRGGAGSPLSAIFGAHALRAISAVLLFTGAPPLAQPLFEGMVLITAVAAASLTLVRDPNRLKAFQ
ncbi:ABC transporter permease [Shinella sp.]|uniref:ABC transporter permease n=1 Tax=Shinella sp. TaxID=1870904 RepID=UPI003F70123D